MGQISKEAQYSFLVQYAGGFLWTWEVNQGPQVNVAVWSGWYQRRPVVHSQRGGPGGQHHKTQLHARRSAPLCSAPLLRQEAAAAINQIGSGAVDLFAGDHRRTC